MHEARQIFFTQKYLAMLKYPKKFLKKEVS